MSAAGSGVVVVAAIVVAVDVVEVVVVAVHGFRSSFFEIVFAVEVLQDGGGVALVLLFEVGFFFGGVQRCFEVDKRNG